ncbi:hypothetical protein [Motilimonas pumila]|uniref:hypothetical protein n=1 Tax=Motilimonas pumila TaxID=2303987 RepID=UPI0011C485EC|nr:hypothetical protein [Motilimonas pumila]
MLNSGKPENITTTINKLPIIKLNKLIAENIRGFLNKPNKIVAKYTKAHIAPIALLPVKFSNPLSTEVNK